MLKVEPIKRDNQLAKELHAAKGDWRRCDGIPRTPHDRIAAELPRSAANPTQDPSIPPHIPFGSSFLVFLLNCLHQEAKSRFDGGEVAIASGGAAVGGSRCRGSTPGCDLPVVTIVGSAR